MRFTFKIETMPSDASSLNVSAFTEGMLQVWLGDTSFLRAEGIPLVEFAIVLEKWRRCLERGELEGLYYASMDFEEEPIFALLYDTQSGSFTPSSVWSMHEGTSVTVAVAKTAASGFLSGLRRELALAGVGLDPIIEHAIEAG